MPNPSEIAVVTALGQAYNSWESVSFERRIGNVVSHCRLRVAEIGDSKHGWASLRLKPRDEPLTLTLAGRTVMSDGFVSTRQVMFAKEQHQIEIVASSRTLKLVVSTPTKWQQFRNSNLQQIANAITAPLGIGFKVMGNNLAGVDKAFERMSVDVGDTCFEFIDRLCRMRNLHLTDDQNGNLVGTRASQGGASIGQLVEGQNILQGHCIMSIDDARAPITAIQQNFGTDSHWGETARDVSATANSSEAGNNTPFVFIAEHPGDKQDMQMRADYQVAYALAQVVECYITVPGWLRPDGSLWVEHLSEPVTIFSPSIFPVDSVTLALRGVKQYGIIGFFLPRPGETQGIA